MAPSTGHGRRLAESGLEGAGTPQVPIFREASRGWRPTGPPTAAAGARAATGTTARAGTAAAPPDRWCHPPPQRPDLDLPLPEPPAPAVEPGPHPAPTGPVQRSCDIGAGHGPRTQQHRAPLPGPRREPLPLPRGPGCATAMTTTSRLSSNADGRPAAPDREQEPTPGDPAASRPRRRRPTPLRPPPTHAPSADASGARPTAATCPPGPLRRPPWCPAASPRGRLAPGHHGGRRSGPGGHVAAVGPARRGLRGWSVGGRLVGRPDLGLVAAAEAGMRLERLALVPAPGLSRRPSRPRCSTASTSSSWPPRTRYRRGSGSGSRPGPGSGVRGCALAGGRRRRCNHVQLRCTDARWSGVGSGRGGGSGRLGERQVTVRGAGPGGPPRRVGRSGC